MKIIYEAFDGTKFDNECECLNHEFILEHLENLLRIEFYEEEGLPPLIIDSSFIPDAFIYNFSNALRIHDQDEFDSFKEWAKEFGWSEFEEEITSPGFWVRKEGRNDREHYWIKVE